MNKQRRPEGWKNPYEDIPIVNIVWEDGRVIHFAPSVIYEAGADAILESLIKNSQRLDEDALTDSYTLHVPAWHRLSGILIFIPDEEEYSV